VPVNEGAELEESGERRREHQGKGVLTIPIECPKAMVLREQEGEVEGI